VFSSHDSKREVLFEQAARYVMLMMRMRMMIDGDDEVIDDDGDYRWW